jgi:hypothetical protein
MSKIISQVEDKLQDTSATRVRIPLSSESSSNSPRLAVRYFLTKAFGNQNYNEDTEDY